MQVQIQEDAAAVQDKLVVCEPRSTDSDKASMKINSFSSNSFTVMAYYIIQPSTIKETKTHDFVPFHTILFIALQGNGPEIQFTPARLRHITHLHPHIIPVQDR